jgi:hypothetical protein
MRKGVFFLALFAVVMMCTGALVASSGSFGSASPPAIILSDQPMVPPASDQIQMGIAVVSDYYSKMPICSADMYGPSSGGNSADCWVSDRSDHTWMESYSNCRPTRDTHIWEIRVGLPSDLADYFAALNDFVDNPGRPEYIYIGNSSAIKSTFRVPAFYIN